MTGLAYKNRRASLAVQPRPHYVHFANSTALVDEETDLRSMGGIVPQEGPGTVTLQCLPLYTLLLALGNPTVHWFILDIEGAEFQVLQTIPWHLVDIEMISVETDLAGVVMPGTREEIIDYMKSQDYRHLSGSQYITRWFTFYFQAAWLHQHRGGREGRSVRPV